MCEITEEEITRTMTVLFYLEEQGLMEEYIYEYEVCDSSQWMGRHDISRISSAFNWKDSAKGYTFWQEQEFDIGCR